MNDADWQKAVENRLRAWPAARNGDALNAAYVGKLMVEAADQLQRQADENTRLREALAARQRPEGETAEQAAQWLRDRGWTVTGPAS